MNFGFKINARLFSDAAPAGGVVPSLASSSPLSPRLPYFLFPLGVLGPEEQKVTGVHTTCCSPL